MPKPIAISKKSNPRGVTLAEKPSRTHEENTVEKQVLGYREAYEFLGISKSFFRKIVSEIPHVQRGRVYFFNRETLLDWASGKLDNPK